jgi:hypothetical protein
VAVGKSLSGLNTGQLVGCACGRICSSMLLSSGMWPRDVWWVVTNLSVEKKCSQLQVKIGSVEQKLFRIVYDKNEEGGGSCQTFLTTYHTTWCHKTRKPILGGGMTYLLRTSETRAH